MLLCRRPFVAVSLEVTMRSNRCLYCLDILLVDEGPFEPKPRSRSGSLLSVDVDPGRDQDLHI